MKKCDVLRIREPKRTTQVNIRISNDLAKWLDKEGLSPTRIFRKACVELGYKKNGKKER